jgi:hypothetical protein
LCPKDSRVYPGYHPQNEGKYLGVFPGQCNLEKKPPLNMLGTLMVGGLSLPNYGGIKDLIVVSIFFVTMSFAGSWHYEMCVFSPLVVLETRFAMALWRWNGLRLSVV